MGGLPTYEAARQLAQSRATRDVMRAVTDVVREPIVTDAVALIPGVGPVASTAIRSASCQGCDASYELAAVEALFDEDGVAVCSMCTSLVKPDVVLFGEFLPAEAMAEAEALASRAELLLCVGSSLEVYPVAGLPSVTMASGGTVAIVTQGPTPYDRAAAVRLDGDVAEQLPKLVEALS